MTTALATTDTPTDIDQQKLDVEAKLSKGLTKLTSDLRLGLLIGAATGLDVDDALNDLEKVLADTRGIIAEREARHNEAAASE